jgi:hypothetical protein
VDHVAPQVFRAIPNQSMDSLTDVNVTLRFLPTFCESPGKGHSVDPVSSAVAIHHPAV